MNNAVYAERLWLLLHTRSLGQRQSVNHTFDCFFFQLGQFEAFASSQEAAVFEHVESVGVESPVGAFSRPVGSSRDLDEAVVEG